MYSHSRPLFRAVTSSMPAESRGERDFCEGKKGFYWTGMTKCFCEVLDVLFFIQYVYVHEGTSLTHVTCDYTLLQPHPPDRDTLPIVSSRAQTFSHTIPTPSSGSRTCSSGKKSYCSHVSNFPLDNLRHHNTYQLLLNTPSIDSCAHSPFACCLSISNLTALLNTSLCSSVSPYPPSNSASTTHAVCTT